VVNNTAHLTLMGLQTQEQATGKSDMDFFPAELAKQYHANERKIFATGKALIDHEELVADQATGETRWHASSKVPLRETRPAR
jgi:PAS fold